MSEEQKPNVEARELEAKFIERFAKQDATINQLTQQLNTQLTNLTAVIGNAQTPREERYEEAPEDTDESWYKNFESAPRKTIKESVKESVQPELSALETKVKKELRSELAAEKQAEKLDDLAYKNFPQLKDEAHPLRKKVEHLLATDPGLNARPSAIYDAARIAYGELVSTGDIVPDSFREEARRLLSIGDATMLPFRSGTQRKEGELTKSQEMFAKRLGVTPDKYRERLKKMGTRRPDND